MIQSILDFLGVTPSPEQMTLIIGLTYTFVICCSYKCLTLISDIIASIFGAERS